jgi:hypothetical protein
MVTKKFKPVRMEENPRTNAAVVINITPVLFEILYGE